MAALKCCHFCVLATLIRLRSVNPPQRLWFRYNFYHPLTPEIAH